jgi:hypothetical protein
MNFKNQFDTENAKLRLEVKAAAKKNKRSWIIWCGLIGIVLCGIMIWISPQPETALILCINIGLCLLALTMVPGFLLAFRYMRLSLEQKVLKKEKELRKVAYEFVAKEVWPALLQALSDNGYTAIYTPECNPLEQRKWVNNEGLLIPAQNLADKELLVTKDNEEFTVICWKLKEDEQDNQFIIKIKQVKEIELVKIN